MGGDVGELLQLLVVFDQLPRPFFDLALEVLITDPDLVVLFFDGLAGLLKTEILIRYDVALRGDLFLGFDQLFVLRRQLFLLGQQPVLDRKSVV